MMSSYRFNSPARTLRLCFLHAPQDDVLRSQLEKHLAAFEREGLLESWSTACIAPGEDWQRSVDTILVKADIILLLVSADFIAADVCDGRQMAKAIARHNEGVARVIPVILRPVCWGDTPLGLLEPLPRNGRAVTTWKDQDEALVSVARGVQKAVLELRLARGERPAVDIDQLCALAGPALLRALSPLSVLDPPELERVSVEILRRSGATLSTLAPLCSLLRRSEERQGRAPYGIAGRLMAAAGLAAPQCGDPEWLDVGSGTGRFQILRHPVTVGQGWSVLAGQGRPHGQIGLDLPMVSLTCAEAAVISDLLGGRLPTAYELDFAGWQGPRSEARRYPWGDGDDPRRSNCREQGLGTACSVFRHDGRGTSPWGVEDMAGNVWEWTSSPGTDDDDRVIVMGGSFLHLQRASQRGACDEYLPEERYPFIGFRVVRT